ncbi:hypothetical protein WN48_03470 [Eufriesea mexicana]|nr:hypothetical protein WN48_03470 [Eufriesea mexicana]
MKNQNSKPKFQRAMPREITSHHDLSHTSTFGTVFRKKSAKIEKNPLILLEKSPFYRVIMKNHNQKSEFQRAKPRKITTQYNLPRPSTFDTLFREKTAKIEKRYFC